MKAKALTLSALTLILLLTACTINRPITATSNPLGTKVGTHTQTGIFCFPPRMNKVSAIAKAAENGGITKISTVDYNITWKFFEIKYDTIVTGE